MALGWWVEAMAYSSAKMQKLTTSMSLLMADFGAQTATMKKPTTAMNAELSDSGVVAVQTKPMSTAMAGATLIPAGSIAVTGEKLTSSMVGSQQPEANSAVTMPMMRSLMTGGIAGTMSATMPLMMTNSVGTQAQSATSAVAIKQMSAALAAAEKESGTIAVAMLKQVAALAATEQPSANIVATMLKAIAALGAGVVTGSPIALVSTAAIGGITLTMPTHSAGNLILAWAFKDNSKTVVSVPSGANWTTVDSAATQLLSGFTMTKKVAASSSEVMGTWTGARLLLVAVFSGAADVGAFTSNAGSSSNPIFSAVTPQGVASSSWFGAFVGHRSVNDSLATPPAGMTNRQALEGSNCDGAIHDTNGVLPSWSSQTVTTAETSNSWYTTVYEILAQGFSGPQFKALGAPLTGSASTTAAVPVPAGVQQFDIVLVLLYVETNQTVTAPSGFTEAPNSPQVATGTNAHDLHVYWKRATGADSGTYGFTIASGLAWRQAYAIAYSGCVQSGSPFDVTTGGAKSNVTDATIPTLSATTSVPTTLVWAMTAYATTGFAFNTPSGMTQRMTDQTDAALAICDSLKLTPGATGNITANMGSDNTTSAAWMGALKSG